MNGARPVLIMAGGTGGHVFPALAVAERLRARGVAGGLDGEPGKVWRRCWCPRPAFRSNGSAWPVCAARVCVASLALPFMLGRALWQAGAILRRLRPPVVLGMGGFASGPGGLAARALGIPLVVHEQNAVAGLTNLARLANQVLEAFPGTFPPARHAMSVGNPVQAIAAPAAADRALRRARRSVAITGAGRQPRGIGAESIGAASLGVMGRCGAAGSLASGRRPVARGGGGAYREAGVAVRLTPFIEDMAAAYGWADLVLCRAGA